MGLFGFFDFHFPFFSFLFFSIFFYFFFTFLIFFFSIFLKRYPQTSSPVELFSKMIFLRQKTHIRTSFSIDNCYS